jgi:hypothetical protein
MFYLSLCIFIPVLSSLSIGQAVKNQILEITRISSSALLRGVRWFKTDVSGLPIYPIFKGQAIQEEASLLKMRLIGSPETSVLNHLTGRNNPEDGRIQFNSGGSLRSRICNEDK